MEKATFAAGCFWGIESAFRSLDGVSDTTVGYTGGCTAEANDETVCGGHTGHAETVEVHFDPTVVSHAELVDYFWQLHDPTTLNRQGPDIGAQYRSTIFVQCPEQEQVAQASKNALEASGRLSRPVVTEIVAASTFHRAEDYHQQYFAKRGITAGCHMR